MTALVLPVSMVFGLVVWSLVARWYLLPTLSRLAPADALRPLLLLHGLRYVGLAFLINGVTAAPLDPRFAIPAACGDLAAAALALGALAAWRKGWNVAPSITWTFNVFGTLDLLIAVSLGLLFTVDGHLGATFFIPSLAVPPLLVTHVVIGILLFKAARTPARLFSRPATTGQARSASPA